MPPIQMTLVRWPLLLTLALPGCLGPWPGDDVDSDTDSTGLVELHPRCTQTYPEDLELPIDPAETFVIGTVFDHSLDTHVGRYRSAELAAIQANGNGGLEGRSFAMIHCTNQVDSVLDGLTKDEATVEAATWLAEVAGVPAIVGPAASGRTQAVYNEVSTEYGTLVISPSATSPSLTPLDGLVSTDDEPGLLWRTAPPDDIQGSAIAWDMATNFDSEGELIYRSEASTSVGVVYQTGAYGEGLEAAFSLAFTADGGTVGRFPFSDDSSRGDAIASAGAGGFDEVLFVSSDSRDVVAFLQGSNSLASYDDIPLFLTDGARNSDVLSLAANASDRFEQVRGSAPAQPSGLVYDSFAATYAAQYSGSDVQVLSFTAQSFDAAWLVIMGHAWAFYQHDGEITGVNIARGLRRVSDGDEVEIRPTNWNLMKSAFASGDSFDVVGASGQLDYDDRGETTAPIDVWTIAPTGDEFDVDETFTP